MAKTNSNFYTLRSKIGEDKFDELFTEDGKMNDEKYKNKRKKLNNFFSAIKI